MKIRKMLCSRCIIYASDAYRLTEVTGRKKVVKKYFKSRIIYENDKRNLYTILNLYFKKNNINYIHINIDEIYLQGRNNNEINLTYSCIEDSKVIHKSINILIKDL